MFWLWHICHVLSSLGRRTATFMFVTWTWTHVRVMCIPPLHILLSCFILALATGMHLPTKDVAAWKPSNFFPAWHDRRLLRSGCSGQMEDLMLSKLCRPTPGEGKWVQRLLPSWRPRSGAKIAWRGSRIVEPKGFSFGTFGTSGKWLEIKRNQCLKAK